MLFMFFLWLALIVLLAVALMTPAELSLGAVCRKAEISIYGIFYLVVGRDSSFKLPPDPGKARASTATRKKRIIFVRHGESVWNEIFNRGFDATFPGRLFRALVREVVLLFALDSLFLDSPLSDEGIVQARCLNEFLHSGAGDELRRVCESSVFVTSCLRRAASTMLLGFRSVLGNRNVWMLSCLQEISRNVDTLALAAPNQVPPLRDVPRQVPPLRDVPRSGRTVQPQGRSNTPGGSSVGSGGNAELSPDKRQSVPCGSAATVVGNGTPPLSCLLPIYNRGNKSVTTLGIHRLEAFCEWVLSDSSPASLQPNVIVAGHSFWFRAFFQSYLPNTAYHACKNAKIVNCGVIAFDLELLEDPYGGPSEYRIDPTSVTSIYGGFEEPKKKKSKKV